MGTFECHSGQWIIKNCSAIWIIMGIMGSTKIYCSKALAGLLQSSIVFLLNMYFQLFSAQCMTWKHTL